MGPERPICTLTYSLSCIFVELDVVTEKVNGEMESYAEFSGI